MFSRMSTCTHTHLGPPGRRPWLQAHAGSGFSGYTLRESDNFGSEAWGEWCSMGTVGPKHQRRGIALVLSWTLSSKSLGSKLGHMCRWALTAEKSWHSQGGNPSASLPSWPLSPTGLSPLISDTHPQKIPSSGAPGSTTSQPQSPGPTAPQPAASQPSVGPWHAPGSELQASCPAGGKEKGQNLSQHCQDRRDQASPGAPVPQS